MDNDEYTGPEYVVIGRAQYGGAWGIGRTKAQAMREATKAGLVKGKGYTVVTFGPESTVIGVNYMGDVRYAGPEPIEVEHVKPRAAASKTA